MGKFSSNFLSLTERTDQETDVAGVSQLITRNEIPSKFIAISDDGDAQRLGISLSAEVDISTGATSYTISGLPSGIRNMQAMTANMSTDGTSSIIVQLGTAGGVVATGYLGMVGRILTTSPNTTSMTTGFGLVQGSIAASDTLQSNTTISLQNATTNTWLATGTACKSNSSSMYFTSGQIALSGELLTVTLTNLSLDAFDNGVFSLLFT